MASFRPVSSEGQWRMRDSRLSTLTLGFGGGSSPGVWPIVPENNPCSGLVNASLVPGAMLKNARGYSGYPESTREYLRPRQNPGTARKVLLLLQQLEHVPGCVKALGIGEFANGRRGVPPPCDVGVGCERTRASPVPISAASGMATWKPLPLGDTPARASGQRLTHRSLAAVHGRPTRQRGRLHARGSGSSAPGWHIRNELLPRPTGPELVCVVLVLVRGRGG